MGRTRARVGWVLGVGALMAGAVAVGGAAHAAPAAAQADWEVMTLPPLEEGDVTTVYDINEAGVAAGESDFVPVLWSAAGTPVALPLPEGYTGGYAVALNEQSQAVGAVFDEEDNERAVVWSNGTATLLGVNDILVGIGASGVMLGFDVSDFDPEEGCCTSTFVEAVDGGSRVTLPPATGWVLLPAALTNNGVVVGTAIKGDLVAGVGWYQQHVFPIGGTGANLLQPVDVIGAPAVLALREDGAGASSVIVTRNGKVVPLAHPSPIDLAVDLNDHGVAVGAGGTSFEEGPEVGRLYAYGSAVSLESLVAAQDHVGDLNDPIALNNSFWIVGNSADGSSWRLRPATGGPRLPSVGKHSTGSARAPSGHRGEPEGPVEPPLAWSSAPRPVR